METAMFLAACVQLRSTTDIQANLDTTERLIRQAASHGAKLVLTPENTPFLGPVSQKVQIAESLDGPIATRLRRLADELNIHLIIGSMTEQHVLADGTIDQKRTSNTSVLWGPNGDQLGIYRKIHLFDVDIPNGLCMKESDGVVPGDKVVVVDTNLGRIGLTICYDLRFPELYRALADQGADIVTIPAAFTLMTGKDHWHPLIRARAIENQCWVMASGQWGTHDEQGVRKSYGHSIIVDAWGTVVADRGDGEGLALAVVDVSQTKKIRQGIPVRNHRRL